VEEQSNISGDFPTVVYPNPEESEAMSIGMKKAKELDADILLGTDPDSDRVGIGVKDHQWKLGACNLVTKLLFLLLII
jgi:phosphoglucomutase